MSRIIMPKGMHLFFGCGPGIGDIANAFAFFLRGQNFGILYLFVIIIHHFLFLPENLSFLVVGIKLCNLKIAWLKRCFCFLARRLFSLYAFNIDTEALQGYARNNPAPPPETAEHHDNLVALSARQRPVSMLLPQGLVKVRGDELLTHMQRSIYPVLALLARLGASHPMP